jgi:hypothetical protein
MGAALVLTNQALWVPGFRGAASKLDRDTGAVLADVTPFGSTVDPNTYAVGPLSADKLGKSSTTSCSSTAARRTRGSTGHGRARGG